MTLSGLRLRWTLIAPIAFAIGTIVMFLTVGIPYQRDTIFLWLLIGLFCFSLADVKGFLRGLVRDWLPFVALLVAYDSLRGTAGRLLPVHYMPQIRVDRWLFGGQVPTVTLQHWLWHGRVVWYDVICWAVYLTHFFFTPVLAAVLWRLNRRRFRKFAMLVIGLSFAGLATYAVFPAAPPWMASQRHLIAPITRIVPQVWTVLPLRSSGGIVERGYQYANNVAAVPSLHAAFSLLVAITLWPRRHRWLRPLVIAYPLAMAFAVVYTGEHYVSDVLLGWIYTVGVVLVGAALPILRHRLRAASMPAAAVASAAAWSGAPATVEPPTPAPVDPSDQSLR